MVEVRTTPTFDKWMDSLRDRAAQARVQVRIDRLSVGNFGDVRPVGDGVAELRIDYGPGYRIYFVRRGNTVVVLLCAGDKRPQSADIQRAKRIAKELG